MGKLRFHEWCGGPAEAATLEALLHKCRHAVQSPEDLEKQVTLLSTELEAGNLGRGELLRQWSGNGVRYEGVAWAVEAAFYRSADIAVIGEVKLDLVDKSGPGLTKSFAAR